MNSGETARVRIKVLVNAAGEWFAHGWHGASDNDPNDTLYEMSDSQWTTEAFVWVTAEIPIPAEITIPDTNVVAETVEISEQKPNEEAAE